MTATKEIPLTGRAPVRIREDEWPILAEATYHDWKGEYSFQSFEHWYGFVRVRQHADGRAIVYARCWHENACQGAERGYSQRAGELLPADSDTDAIVDAIQRVHGEIDIVDEGHQNDWWVLADECIGDLPPEDL